MTRETSDREIRAIYNPDSIRVYQAFSDEIADSAINHNTFVSPPFKMTRMTWIKPSFMWMMYRAGWGEKDNKQKRILAIDITHDGFLWALSHSCLSSYNPEVFKTKDEWEKKKSESSVKIQWDPERNISLEKLKYRTIQIGLSGEAVQYYTKEWIIKITDITDLAYQIKSNIEMGFIEKAKELAPEEKIYPLSSSLAHSLGMTNS